MNEAMKTKNNDSKNTLLKKAGRVLAPLLVAGIMTATGNVDAGSSKVSGVPLSAANIVSGKISRCKKSWIAGKEILKAPEKKCEMKVKKGDIICKIEMTTGKSFFRVEVSKIDKKGVTFQMDLVVFMNHFDHGKFRINFDGTRTLPYWEPSGDMKVLETSDPKIVKLIWVESPTPAIQPKLKLIKDGKPSELKKISKPFTPQQ